MNTFAYNPHYHHCPIAPHRLASPQSRVLLLPDFCLVCSTWQHQQQAVTTMPISPLDFVLLQFGSPGYYQIFLSFLLCCLHLPIIFTEYLFRYYIFEPPHRCQLSNRHVREHGDALRGLHKNEWYPVAAATTSTAGAHQQLALLDWLAPLSNSSTVYQFDQCNVFLDPVHHWKGTQPCPGGWEFWMPNNERNLITDFTLVCDRRYLVTVLFYAACNAALLGAIEHLVVDLRGCDRH